MKYKTRQTLITWAVATVLAVGNTTVFVFGFSFILTRRDIPPEQVGQIMVGACVGVFAVAMLLDGMR